MVILACVAIVAGVVTFFRPLIGVALVVAAFLVPAVNGRWQQHTHPCNPKPPYQPDGCWDHYAVMGDVDALLLGVPAVLGAGLGGAIRLIRRNRPDDDPEGWEAFQANGALLPDDDLLESPRGG